MTDRDRYLSCSTKIDISSVVVTEILYIYIAELDQTCKSDHINDVVTSPSPPQWYLLQFYLRPLSGIYIYWAELSTIIIPTVTRLQEVHLAQEG